jgi:CO dehydrogenase/acetyl-CoA synthase gamma subunit (corrinoid Fe-S protein)
MEPHRSLEGTGEEIAKYAKAHPRDRFVLTAVSVRKSARRQDQEKWAEAMKIIESFRGKLPILPLDATSTDSLYD